MDEEILLIILFYFINLPLIDLNLFVYVNVALSNENDGSAFDFIGLIWLKKYFQPEGNITFLDLTCLNAFKKYLCNFGTIIFSNDIQTDCC